jgi:hypothetical protein
MAQIQPITYPLNLGTADDLSVTVSLNTDQDGGRIFYTLNDTSVTPYKRMSSGTLFLTEEQVTADGFDKAWALEYTATELGVTLTV